MNQSQQPKIAIIEDNKLLSQTLSLWLENQLGYSIVGCAEDGETGLQLCLDHRPDLALIDIRIPKIDGLALVEILREQLPATRLMAMSGLVDPYTIWRVGQSGVHGYVVKTEDVGILRKGIQTVLRNGEFFSSVFQEVKTNWLSKPEAFQKVLSAREQEVLQHVIAAWDDEKIGKKFNISTSTVGVHRKNIRKKLDLHNDRELLGYALKWGLGAIQP